MKCTYCDTNKLDTLVSSERRQNNHALILDIYIFFFFWQVNDDTVLESTGWTEKLIEQLLRFHPPNVGVAGPWFRDGNIAIMTHDFVHKTHIDIFGFYYPRVFTDWFADGKF